MHAIRAALGICLLLSGGVCAAPSDTQPATAALLGGDIVYTPPANWSRQHSDLPAETAAVYLAADHDGYLALEVLPPNAIVTSAAAKQIIAQLRLNRQKSKQEMIEPAKLDRDPRFAIKIHERDRTREGQIAQEFHLYRKVAGRVLELDVQSLSQEPAHVQDVLNTAEDLLMSAHDKSVNSAPAKVDQPVARIYHDAAGHTLPYLLLKPAHYDSARRYPLVLFYHGAGERGNDNYKQWRNGVEIFQTPENRAKFPCFVIAPQCPAASQWVNVPWAADSEVLPAEPSEPLKLSLEILAAVQREFSIDPSRIYVTGLSMGGFATWDVIARHPDLFAAAVPICGGGDEHQAERIKSIPIWAFHGGADPVVKTFRSRHMIAAIRQAGGDPSYTEYPGVGHGSWTAAYHDPKLLDWMFSQKLPQQPGSP